MKKVVKKVVEKKTGDKKQGMKEMIKEYGPKVAFAKMAKKKK